jgi:cell division septum initiation protein DivIVA
MPDQSSAATEHAILAEITRPLESLPEDPLALVDADFPSALRGYDRMAVDEYVRQARRLVAELQATRSPEAAVRRALERVGEQISGILQRAHETAEQITAQSRSEAEDRLQQARLEAAQIAGAAEERVRDLDADTDRIWLERERIVADAEDLSAQLLALAKEAAARFPADAEAAATEAGGTTIFDAPAAEPAGPFDDDGGDEELTSDDEGGHDEDEDAGDGIEDEAQGAKEVEDDTPTEVAEPVDRSEIERTVAFKPLDTDDDTTVIRPASEAANRRADK